MNVGGHNLLKFTKAHGNKPFCNSLSFLHIRVVYYSWKLTCRDIGKSSSFPYFSLLNVKNHRKSPTIYLTLMICLICFQSHLNFIGLDWRVPYKNNLWSWCTEISFESPFGHHPSRSIWVLQVLKFCIN